MYAAGTSSPAPTERDCPGSGTLEQQRLRSAWDPGGRLLARAGQARLTGSEAESIARVRRAYPQSIALSFGPR